MMVKLDSLAQRERAGARFASGFCARAERSNLRCHFRFWPNAGAAMGSPAGKAVVADLANFATGGVTILVSAVE
jgi:hypothetical protein